MPGYLILLGVLLAAIAAGALFYHARKFEFWATGAVWLIKLAAPSVTKRMDPKLEVKKNVAYRRGQEWDFMRKRPKRNER